jgi:hypothetical protein
MAYSITSPPQSFVQFSETGVIDHCVFDNLRFCLPVFEDGDVAFQFYINGTESEIDALCGVYGTPIGIGIVSSCDDQDFLLEFTANPYNDEPEIFRVSDTQLLVNWSHGVPGFTNVIGYNECFKIRIEIGAVQFCSNCLERTSDNCFTSVIEYSADENAFGFNYCGSGTTDQGELSCEPTIITFANQGSLSIPYTQMLRDKYGPVPNVSAWIDDGSGNLLNMSITISFDAYPVNVISADFGGLATGIVVIK